MQALEQENLTTVSATETSTTRQLARVDRRRFTNTLALLAIGIPLTSACNTLGLTGSKPPTFEKAEDKSANRKGYLTLPFRRADLPDSEPYKLAEGFKYSAQETAIHGMTDHLGIDLDVKYGTPLVVPVEGAYAVASYQTLWPAKRPDGQPQEEDGKPVRIGFGYFVELRDSETNRIVQLAHMSAIDPNIPFYEPKYNADKDSWDPQTFNLATEELTKRGLAQTVRRGQDLGLVGYSGLMWGSQIDYAAGSQKVLLPNEQNISWDDPHAHLELAERINGAKQKQVDPYDIYAEASQYPSPSRPHIAMGQSHLWRLGSDGLPAFSA